MKTGLIAIGSLAAVVVSFVIGESMGQRSMLARMRIELDGTQAMLAFNRLDEERKIKSWLSRGCITQAQSEMDIDEDQDTKLLAEFFKGKLDLSARKYISDRDPNLVNTLSAFKSKYGDRWEQPECNKVD